MPNVFGRHIFRDADGHYCCYMCKKWFYTETSILAHCRDTTIHKWCEPCHRVFTTEDAKQQHLRLSSAHNICFLCARHPDFDNEDELYDHESEVHNMCFDCDTPYHTKQQLSEHLQFQHAGSACMICLCSYGTKSALHQHMKTHEQKNIKCPGCDRTFSQYSHALVHLEHSSCSSVKQIKKLAISFEDEGSHYFIDDNSRFFCDHCDCCFDRLSSLYAHTEDSMACYPLLQSSDSMLKALVDYIWHRIL